MNNPVKHGRVNALTAIQLRLQGSQKPDVLGIGWNSKIRQKCFPRWTSIEQEAFGKLSVTESYLLQDANSAERLPFCNGVCNSLFNWIRTLDYVSV